VGAAGKAGTVGPGDVVEGRYRVLEALGEGGMGLVLGAEHVETGARVAVKVMLASREDTEARKRFAREARAVRAIESSHVARVLDHGELADGTPFLVMERLEGAPLDLVIHERAPLPVEEAVDHVLQACEGVAHAHAAGLIHRDLKPSNLFLCRVAAGEGLVKVLDFGIAKAVVKIDTQSDGTSLTESNAMLGSPQYMSPEQIWNAKEVDERTDVWALGLILHKLLTGQPAFAAEHVGQHVALVLTGAPTPLRAQRPDAPAALEEVVLRCLRRDVARRFRDVGALAAAIAPFGPASALERLSRIQHTLDSGRASGRRAPVAADAIGDLPTAPDPDAPTAPDWAKRPPTSSEATTREWAGPTGARAPRTARIGLALLGVATAGVAAVLATRAPSGDAPSSTPTTLHAGPMPTDGVAAPEPAPIAPDAVVPATPSTSSPLPPPAPAGSTPVVGYKSADAARQAHRPIVPRGMAQRSAGAQPAPASPAISATPATTPKTHSPAVKARGPLEPTL
jgi:serine/threonine-protein kinase